LNDNSNASKIHGTTVIGIKRNQEVALAADGQVTLGEKVAIKHKARKVRKIYNDQVITGFAGSTADALNLFDKFEGKLEEHHGKLLRAAVELTKEWRTDKILRRLEALLMTADKERILIISGNGDIIEPDDNIAAIGSGGSYALAAARVLAIHSDLSAAEIAVESLKAASSICVYTNQELTVEKL